MEKRSLIKFPALSAFDMRASAVCVRRDDPDNYETDSHVHPECEIYINLSGNVSFMVEKRIYPIVPGSIVITRPYEYHHCIYHSNEPHEHVCLLFSLPFTAEDAKAALLPKFFDRPTGTGNLLSLEKQKREELVALCQRLAEGEATESEKYAIFFRLIHLIEKADTVTGGKKNYPPEIDTALSFIDESFSKPELTVADISTAAGVSVNTLERHFRSFLSMSPLTYLKKKRLARAAELLFTGKTVSEAGEESGFSDYSHFIALFKSAYGITPLKYKKATKE